MLFGTKQSDLKNRNGKPDNIYIVYHIIRGCDFTKRPLIVFYHFIVANGKIRRTQLNMIEG